MVNLPPVYVLYSIPEQQERSRATKPAICHKCGKDMKGHVPENAEEVTCFHCCEGER